MSEPTEEEWRQFAAEFQRPPDWADREQIIEVLRYWVARAKLAEWKLSGKDT